MKIVNNTEVRKFKEYQSYVDRRGKSHKVYKNEDGSLFEVHECNNRSSGCGVLLQITENDIHEKIEGGGYFDAVCHIFFCLKCGKKNYIEHVYTSSFSSPLKAKAS